MKFISFATGVVCFTLLASAGSAQTGSSSTNAQASGSVQAGSGTATVETRQDANVAAQRKGGKAETKTDAQSHNNAGVTTGGANLGKGTQLQAMLKTTLDSKRAEDGQQFLLKTTKDVKAGGQNVIKKGSTLVGHVVTAQGKAEGKGRSEMTLMLDGIQQGDQIIPLQAVFVGMRQHTVQAMGDSEVSSAMPPMATPQRSSGGGGLLGGGGVIGGATGAVNSTVSATSQTVGSIGSSTLGTSGTLSNTTNGTLSTTSSVTNASTLNEPGRLLFSLQNGLTATTSSRLSGATEFNRVGKDVQLEKGTEFVLAITGSSRASASTTR